MPPAGTGRDGRARRHRMTASRRWTQISADTGAVVVPPFDDPAVIAGQGTVGLEIAADLAATE